MEVAPTAKPPAHPETATRALRGSCLCLVFAQSLGDIGGAGETSVRGKIADEGRGTEVLEGAQHDGGDI